MNTTTMKRGLLGLALSMSASMPAPAAQPASGTAATVMALSEAEVTALKGNFSENRFVWTQRNGEQIYQAICQGCHMPQGQGARGVGFYPPLANNARLAAGAYPVAIVMNGLHGMPGFSDRLSNEQVAEVVNYLRSHFGNQFADKVEPQDVQPFRK